MWRVAFFREGTCLRRYMMHPKEDWNLYQLLWLYHNQFAMAL